MSPEYQAEMEAKRKVLLDKRAAASTRRVNNRKQLEADMVHALTSRGHEAKWTEGRLHVNGANLYIGMRTYGNCEDGGEPYQVDFNSGFHGRGQQRRFRQLKTGGLKWDEFVPSVVSAAAETKRRQEAYARTEANRDAAKDLREKLKIAEYCGPFNVSASSDPEKPFRLKIDTILIVTAERTEEVVNALRALGIGLPQN